MITPRWLFARLGRTSETGFGFSLQRGDITLRIDAMRRFHWVALLVLPMLGCAAPQPVCTGKSRAAGGAAADGLSIQATQPSNCRWRCAVARPIAANLALGSHPQHVQIGELLTYRSDWPAVRMGYVFEDIASFFIHSYDDQSFYDRLGGGHFNLFEATRQGVVVR